MPHRPRCLNISPSSACPSLSRFEERGRSRSTPLLMATLPACLPKRCITLITRSRVSRMTDLSRTSTFLVRVTRILQRSNDVVMGRGHDHGGATAAGAERSRLIIVLCVTVTILVAEILGGLVAHSLVLIADAGHMAADAAGIGLSLLAVSFAARPTSEQRTFGYERAEILAALVNAIVLLGIGVFILVEAARRLTHPEATTPWLMAVFGMVALLNGNAASLGLLRRGESRSLSLRARSWRCLTSSWGVRGSRCRRGDRRVNPVPAARCARIDSDRRTHPAENTLKLVRDGSGCAR